MAPMWSLIQASVLLVGVALAQSTYDTTAPLAISITSTEPTRNITTATTATTEPTRNITTATTATTATTPIPQQRTRQTTTTTTTQTSTPNQNTRTTHLRGTNTVRGTSYPVSAPLTTNTTTAERTTDVGGIVGGVLSALILITLVVVAFIFRKRVLLCFRVLMSRIRRKRQTRNPLDRNIPAGNRLSATYVNVSRETNGRPASLSDPDTDFYGDPGDMTPRGQSADRVESGTQQQIGSDPVYVNGDLGASSDRNVGQAASQVTDVLYYSYNNPTNRDPLYGNIPHNATGSQQPVSVIYEHLKPPSEQNGEISENYSALSFNQ